MHAIFRWISKKDDLGFWVYCSSTSKQKDTYVRGTCIIFEKAVVSHSLIKKPCFLILGGTFTYFQKPVLKVSYNEGNNWMVLRLFIRLWKLLFCFRKFYILFPYRCIFGFFYFLIPCHCLTKFYLKLTRAGLLLILQGEMDLNPSA